MAVFTPGNPVETNDPFVPVEALPPGSHTFRLVVVDESGNESLPAFAKVEIKRSPNETVTPRVRVVEKLVSPFDADHDPVGKELWVTGNDGEITRAPSAFAFAVSLSEGRVVGSVQIGSLAGDIAVSRSTGTRVGLIANPGAGTATLISLSERAVLHVFQLKDGPDGVAVTPDGTRGAVAIPSTGQVIVLDLRDFRVLAEIQVGRQPSKIILAQEGRIAFVNCVGEGVIVGLDMRRFTVVGSFKVGGGEDSGPVQFTATQAGFPVRTANQGNASASAALSATRINDVRLDFKPAAVAADADGKRAFLAGPDTDTLAMIEAEAPEARIFRMIAPAGGYKSVAATRDAGLVAVAHPMKQAASFYRGEGLELRAILDNLKAPSRIVVTDDGEFFCILDPGANTISLVEVSSIA